MKINLVGAWARAGPDATRPDATSAPARATALNSVARRESPDEIVDEDSIAVPLFLLLQDEVWLSGTARIAVPALLCVTAAEPGIHVADRPGRAMRDPCAGGTGHVVARATARIIC